MNFSELVNEEMSDRLTHYTSYKNLKKILTDGYLKGKGYETNLGTIRGKFTSRENRPLEFCLVRSTNREPWQLSDDTINMEVQFLFDMDNIKNIRGIKKPKPIAEFPATAMHYIKDGLSKMVDYKFTTKEKAEELLKAIPKKSEDELGKMIDDLVDDPSDPKYEKFLRNLYSDAYNYKYFIEKRENEERLDLTKNVIQLSPKYVHIIINKNEFYNKDKVLVELVNRWRKREPELIEIKENKNA